MDLPRNGITNARVLIHLKHVQHPLIQIPEVSTLYVGHIHD